MKTYNHFENLLKEAAEANDLVLAAYLLDGLKLIDPEHDKQARRVYRGLLKKDSLHRMANLFSEKLGVDQGTAISYFEKILFDTNLSRSEVAKFLPKLGDAYAAVFVSALSMGDIEVATLVRNEYATGFPLKSDTHDSIYGHRIFGCSEHMTNLNSIEETKAIFELIVDSGLGDLAGKGDRQDSRCWQWMVSSQKWAKPKALTGAVSLSIPLPKLSNGMVTNPEIPIAFSEGSRHTNYPEMYSKCLAWIDNNDLGSLDESVVKIHPVRKFTAGSTGKFDTFELEDFSPQLLEGLIYTRYREPVTGIDAITRIDVGIQAVNGTRLDDAHLRFLSERLMQADQLVGFNHPTGYTLCLVDTQWLELFDIGGFDKVALDRARNFVSKFFPVEIIHDHAEIVDRHPDYTPKPQGVVDVSTYSATPIFLLLADDSIREEIKKVIPSLLWNELFRRSGTSLGGRGLALAKEHLGLDLTESKSFVTMTWKTIEELALEGYSLWLDESKTRRMEVRIDHQTSDHARSKVDDYKNLIAIGGWPDGVSEYESIGQAISKGVRLNDVTLPLAYLRAMGVENVIPHIKTKAQWGFFFKTFANSEIAPHLDLMPEHHRADLLANDLGL